MSADFRSRFAGKVVQRADDGSVLPAKPPPSSDTDPSAPPVRAQPANRRLRQSSGATRLPDSATGVTMVRHAPSPSLIFGVCPSTGVLRMGL